MNTEATHTNIQEDNVYADARSPTQSGPPSTGSSPKTATLADLYDTSARHTAVSNTSPYGNPGENHGN